MSARASSVVYSFTISQRFIQARISSRSMPESYPNNSITPRSGILTHSGRLFISYTIS